MLCLGDIRFFILMNTILGSALNQPNSKPPQTGTAVSYLIRSIAKLAETSDNGTALISFLYTRS
jgi:hypothetical protein